MSSLRLECYTGLLGPLFTDTHLNLSALFFWGGSGGSKGKRREGAEGWEQRHSKGDASWPH